MKTKLLATAVGLTALLATTSFGAAEQSIIAQVADGRAWNAKGDDGRPALKLTLNPNGTGNMKAGIMGFNLKWKANGDNGFCMSGGPIKNSCMTLTPTAKGFSGISDDGKSLALTRG
jgi:hypothetical protein